MKHLWTAATLALVAVLLLVAGAYSQTAPLRASARPLLLDVQRSVPITLTLDIPLPSGVTQTVEVPATVDLAVTINLSSPLPPTLSVGTAQPLAPAARAALPMAGKDHQGLAYTVENETAVELLQWSVDDLLLDSGFEMVGEMRNTAQERTLERYNVEIVVTLYDADGNVLDAGSGSPELAQIKPGQTSPFKVQLSADLADIARYAIQVQVAGE